MRASVAVVALIALTAISSVAEEPQTELNAEAACQELEGKAAVDPVVCRNLVERVVTGTVQRTAPVRSEAKANVRSEVERTGDAAKADVLQEWMEAHSRK